MKGEGLCPFPNIDLAYTGPEPVSPFPWRRVGCIQELCELWAPEIRGETFERWYAEEHRRPGAEVWHSVPWVEPGHCGLVSSSREYPAEEEA